MKKSRAEESTKKRQYIYFFILLDVDLVQQLKFAIIVSVIFVVQRSIEQNNNKNEKAKRKNRRK